MSYDNEAFAPQEFARWEYYNPNPRRKRVGDCSVRALCKALGESWDDVYAELTAAGYYAADMPSANSVWGAVLRRHGFRREIIPNTCPDCYTVADFCIDHPDGNYGVATVGHAVGCTDGVIYDSWHSSAYIPLYFWEEVK